MRREKTQQRREGQQQSEDSKDEGHEEGAWQRQG